jgi:riboflavin synthase
VFTGLIEDVGVVVGVDKGADGAELAIATDLAEHLAPGESIAVDGVCLTAKSPGFDGFKADVMRQTMGVTAFAWLEAGSRVNLERPLQATARLDGHIVQGHVDGVGAVVSVEDDGFARRLRVMLPPGPLRYTIERGSIALNGVSLTIAELGDHWIEVSLIPETLERTNLGEARVGSRLNVECDLIAKHVERLMAPFAGKERT